jgi:hypothetical protein
MHVNRNNTFRWRFRHEVAVARRYVIYDAWNPQRSEPTFLSSGMRPDSQVATSPRKVVHTGPGGRGKRGEDHSPTTGDPIRGSADSIGRKKVRFCRNRSEIGRREAEVGRRRSQSSPSRFEIVGRDAEFAGVVSKLTGGDRNRPESD